MGISAVLIAKNEASRIARCLESVSFCRERVVIDSGSTDGTPKKAALLGADVHHRAFDDFASQKNFAISKAHEEWVLLIDADESIPPALRAEVEEATAAGRFPAYWIRRRNRIFGRWMEHGSHRSDWQLRLIRRESAVFEGRIHERIRWSGPSGKLRQTMEHDSTPDIRSYMRKLDLYTTLDVEQARHARQPMGERILRRAVVTLAKRIIWEGAWRDGVEGLVFAVLSAYYDVVRKAKLWESAHV